MHHCTVQNQLNREWLRYSPVFLASINFHLIWVYLVPILEIILQNVFSIYKILVKFLDSWSAHALKVNIFFKLSWMKDKTTIFYWEVRESHSDFDQLRNSHLILVMFVSADQFLDIFLDLQFVLCIITRYLQMCTFLQLYI